MWNSLSPKRKKKKSRQCITQITAKITFCINIFTFDVRRQAISPTCKCFSHLLREPSRFNVEPYLSRHVRMFSFEPNGLPYLESLQPWEHAGAGSSMNFTHDVSIFITFRRSFLIYGTSWSLVNAAAFINIFLEYIHFIFTWQGWAKINQSRETLMLSAYFPPAKWRILYVRMNFFDFLLTTRSKHRAYLMEQAHTSEFMYKWGHAILNALMLNVSVVHEYWGAGFASLG